MSSVIRTAKGPVPRGLRPWLPGESGNPGGHPRKRQRSVAKAIREMLADDPGRLIALLLDIAEDSTAQDKDRIAACRELLDRGYGKAPEFVPIKDGDPLEMGQLEQAIEEILGRRRDQIEARPQAQLETSYEVVETHTE